MTNEEQIIKKFAERMAAYTERPNENLWKNIANNSHKPTINWKKVIVIVGSVVLLSSFIALISVPETQKQEVLIDNNNFQQIDKQEIVLTQNNNIAEYQNKQQNTPQQDVLQQYDVEQMNNEPANTIVTNNVTIKENNRQENQHNNTQTNVNNTVNKDNISKKQENTSEQIDFQSTPKNNYKAGDNNSDINLSEQGSLIFPNAFIPEGTDIINKIFKPASEPSIPNVTDYKLRIFSRNGQLVFTSNDVLVGWDGTVKGKLAQGGVYVYFVEYKNAEGKDKSQKGTVALIR